MARAGRDSTATTLAGGWMPELLIGGIAPSVPGSATTSHHP